MNEYMITIELPSFTKEEVTLLIPEQRARVNRLMDEGILTSYCLSTDRIKLWITLIAASSEAVEKILNKMPLFKFMHYEVIELMFHDSSVFASAHFSMN